MIHTNRCKHCGKTKEEHYGIKMVDLNPNNDVWEIGFGDYCSNKKNRFVDSGLAALDTHKEELYEMSKNLVFDIMARSVGIPQKTIELNHQLYSILNQIEKEKCSILNQIEKEK